MSQLLENIAEFLENNDLGTRGETIFVGYLPDDVGVDGMISIDQTGGVSPDVDMPIGKPSVQIMVRTLNYDDGMSKIQQIFELLHATHDDFVLIEDGVDIMRVFALNEPQHYDRDEAGRDIFSCTFVFQLRK
jgi:hypothetical protein